MEARVLRRNILTGLCCATLALLPALAWGADLTCAGDNGPLLSIGAKGVNRLGLAGGRVLEMERWEICFRCVGMPRLDMDLKDVKSGGTGIQILAEVKPCGRDEAVSPGRSCLDTVGVRAGGTETRRCRFPEGTTLETLWTALTRSSLPANIDPWWSFPER
jgi:hypothetical protein